MSQSSPSVQINKFLLNMCCFSMLMILKILIKALLVGSSATEDCNEASNKECDESQVLLRVKDPLAALYPFVGIVVEVHH